MELDARQLPEGATLEADVCIAGAGPAGLVLAGELSDAGISVLLLESGGSTATDWGRALNEGRVVGDGYAGLAATRHRQLGGAACIWNTPVAGEPGAKYVPLDPWDLDSAPGTAAKWPMPGAGLIPYYRRAQIACGLGPFAYSAADWPDPARPPLVLPDQLLTSAVYQFGTGRIFTETYPRRLRRSPGVRVCLHATLLRLAGGSHSRVIEARIGSPSGRTQVARASWFVLAAGAIENARILLLSDLGTSLDHVGRHFMEHPRDHALTLTAVDPDLYARARFYDAHRFADGTVIGGRLALSEAALREHRLPNASVTLLPRLRTHPEPAGLPGRLLARIREFGVRGPRSGYGWSAEPHPAEAYDGFQLLVNLEQRPHPENRVSLAADRDALGLPRAVLHLTWRPEEQAELERLRGLVAKAVEAAALGRIRVETGRPPDLNAHHHAGTTRMHPDERQGVVDIDCRVHGIDNLFIAGSSVFPRAGFANPTLTVAALALRLADHLKARF